MFTESYYLEKIANDIHLILVVMRDIRDYFLIPVWIIAIAMVIFAITCVAITVITVIYLRKTLRIYEQQFATPEIEFKKAIRKAQRAAKHRIRYEKGGEKDEEADEKNYLI